MKKFGFAVTAVSLLVISATAHAVPVEVPPVGAAWDMKCNDTGGPNGALEITRTWKIVKNDGENFRSEANDGSYFEGPIWGTVVGFFNSQKTSNAPLITMELDSDGLKSAADIEAGKSFSGYLKRSQGNRTFQQRHDVTVKERLEKETPFGKTEVLWVSDRIGSFASINTWYSPELKNVVEMAFEVPSEGRKITCQMMTKPQ